MGVCGGRLAYISGGLEGIHSVEGTWNSASEAVTPPMKGTPLRWFLLKAKAVWLTDTRAYAAMGDYGSGEGLYGCMLENASWACEEFLWWKSWRKRARVASELFLDQVLSTCSPERKPLGWGG